jgi:hypothetical protein
MSENLRPLKGLTIETGPVVYKHSASPKLKTKPTGDNELSTKNQILRTTYFRPFDPPASAIGSDKSAGDCSSVCTRSQIMW